MAIMTYSVILFTACLATVSFALPIADPVTEGTELVFAFMVHRHGDRTPVTTTLSVVSGAVNITEAQALIDQYGSGQLTDAGKRTGRNCGKFIRRRYDELLAERFNKSEVYIRTTDSTRVKMTALTALSAVFPPESDQWSDEISWAPVTYTTVPAKYDFNEAAMNCPTFVTGYNSLYTDTERLEPYSELIEEVSDIIDYDFTSSPITIVTVYDVFVSLNSLGYNLSDEIKDLMGEIREAAGVGWDILYGNGDYLHLQAGPLLNEFFEYANATIAGSETPTVRIYAAHDANVYPFVAITGATPRPGAPKYASLYSLELRKVTETGQYVVLPVYLDDPNVGVEKYLQIEGCSGQFLCDYSEFLSLTSQNVLDEDTWRTECGFSVEEDVDTSGID